MERELRMMVVSEASGLRRTARAVRSGDAWEGQVVAGGRVLASTADTSGAGREVTRGEGSGVYASAAVALDRAVAAAHML